MSRVSALLCFVAAGAAVGLMALWWHGHFASDPAADPELSLPPSLVKSDMLGRRRWLFDGQSTTGWEIAGPSRVDSGTLELGGAEATRAVVPRTLEEGEQLEFDFFQEGPGDTRLWVRPTLIDPQPPDPEYCREFSYDLQLSGFAYQRWHNVRIAALHEGTDTQVTIGIHPYHDSHGKGGGATHSLPARGGCRFQLVFEVAPGSQLYLRNILHGSGAKSD